MAKADDRKRKRQHKEVDENYKAFKKLLPSIIGEHRGEFAFKNIVRYFDTAGDAYVAGKELYGKDGIFSIQEVTDCPKFIMAAPTG